MSMTFSRFLKRIIPIFVLTLMITAFFFPLVEQASSRAPGTPYYSVTKDSPAKGASGQLKPQAGYVVNPYPSVNSEPAPMGIADYGLGPNNNPYSYNTTSFFGKATITNLLVNGAYGQSLTFQLNVNLVFSLGGQNYTYWIQDVAYLNTNSTNRYIQFLDNVWNFSSHSSSMHNSTISGNGTCYSSSSGTYYYDGANNNLPGNNVKVKYPTTIELRVVSYLKQSNGVQFPAVAFEYNDGNGWITYDNAIFHFAANPSNTSFLVDGFNYNPYGTFYDAELIMGGPGGGSQTVDQSSNLSLQLYYWNGNNYQMVVNAYNFGRDTAEGISNVTTTTSFAQSGNITATYYNGSGTLSILYSKSDVSVLNIQSMLNSGYLYVNGSQITEFISGDVNVTLHPGNYTVELFTSDMNLFSEKQISLVSGEYLSTTMGKGYYLVNFNESGLPFGKAWSVTINGTTKHSSTNEITFSLKNGTYIYKIGEISGYHASSYSNSFVVNGNDSTIDLFWHLETYNVTFRETGLPNGTAWSIFLNGTVMSTSNTSMALTLVNGTYNYSIVAIGGYHTNQYSREVAINGKNLTEDVVWSEFTYTVTFKSSGLASGHSWYVVFNGVKKSSTGSEITFNLPNGTYSYSIGNVTSYRHINGGNIVINGSFVNVDVKFLPVYSTQYIYAVGIFAAIGIAGGLLAYAIRKR